MAREDVPPRIPRQQRRPGWRGRVGRVPPGPGDPGRGGGAPGATIRPDPGQAPGVLDAGKPQLRPLFRHLPGRAGLLRPEGAQAAQGRSVFQQPDPANPDGYLQPFHLDTINSGAAAVPSLSHNWQPQHASWNNGLMDGWVRSRIAYNGTTKGPYTMGYLTRDDIPFHWALADAFTLLDGYHCSVMGPTDPNRVFWESGTIDPQAHGGGPVLEMADCHPPFTFESGGETLFKAGITFKCYGAPGTFKWFPKLQSKTSIPIELWNAVNASSALYGDGTPGGIGNPANPTPATHPTMAFDEDCANGVLPDVSIIAANNSSEHPPSPPAKGAVFLAGTLDALLGNEDLRNTTVFVIQYDENDGFFLITYLRRPRIRTTTPRSS